MCARGCLQEFIPHYLFFFRSNRHSQGSYLLFSVYNIKFVASEDSGTMPLCLTACIHNFYQAATEGIVFVSETIALGEKNSKIFKMIEIIREQHRTRIVVTIQTGEFFNYVCGLCSGMVHLNVILITVVTWQFFFKRAYRDW